VTSRIRSAVRRGAFFAMVVGLVGVCGMAL